MVEALVVAVIIGILSAVVIMMYTDYLGNQKQAMAKGIAQSGAAAANMYWRRTGLVPDSAALKLFLSAPERYTVTIRNMSVVVSDVSDPENLLAARVKYK